MPQNTSPAFLKDFGLIGDPTSELAFNQLDSILSAQGTLQGSNKVDERLRRRGASPAVLAQMRARQAQLKESQQIKDLGLADAFLIKPALEKRNLDLNKLRGRVQAAGGNAQLQGQLFTGLAAIAQQAADIWSIGQANKAKGLTFLGQEKTSMVGHPNG